MIFTFSIERNSVKFIVSTLSPLLSVGQGNDCSTANICFKVRHCFFFGFEHVCSESGFKLPLCPLIDGLDADVVCEEIEVPEI